MQKSVVRLMSRRFGGTGFGLAVLFFCVSVVLGEPASSAFTMNSAIVSPRSLGTNVIHNFFKLSDRIYSGAAPEGEAAFAELQKLGIKTVISVDGSKPDVATAKKFGLRYVHLPIGYDGVPAKQAVRLVKAAEELSGPIFIHCHHGMHRGPAGAAVICMGTENWTPEQAVDWLKTAKTATNYTGLYKSVREFKKPTAEELKKTSTDFPETMQISPMVDAMVEIDGRFDHLKLIKEAGFSRPEAHPDLDPVHEALLLEELFKELLRSPESQKRGKEFVVKLETAGRAVETLHRALQEAGVAKEKAEAAFQQVNNACASCHKAYRN